MPVEQQFPNSTEPEVFIIKETVPQSSNPRNTPNSSPNATNENQPKNKKSSKNKKKKKNKKNDQVDESVSTSQSTMQNPTTKKTVAILGDSIIKGLKWWKMSRHDTKINMQCFRGSTVEDMESYMLPALRKDPSHVILHVGAHDLSTSTPNKLPGDCYLV